MRSWPSCTPTSIPRGEVEELVVERVAVAVWKLQRAVLFEVGALEAEGAAEVGIGRAAYRDANKGQPLGLVVRYSCSCEASMYQALHELERRQAKCASTWKPRRSLPNRLVPPFEHGVSSQQPDIPEASVSDIDRCPDFRPTSGATALGDARSDDDTGQNGTADVLAQLSIPTPGVPVLVLDHPLLLLGTVRAMASCLESVVDSQSHPTAQANEATPGDSRT